MCNSSWSALECMFLVYLSQMVIFILGVIALFLGFISTDAPIAEAESGHTKPLKSSSNKKLFLKVKDYEIHFIPIPHKIRVALQIVGGLLVIIGVGWILITEIQRPVINLQSGVLSSSTPGVEEFDKKIESFSTKVFAFSGAYDDPPQQGFGFLDVEHQPENRFVYRFSFDLPADGTYGYAGFTFWFIDPKYANRLIDPKDTKQFSPQDLTGFNSIEITLRFESDLHHCKLFIKDIDYIEHDDNHVNSMSLSQFAPPNSKIEKRGNEYKYTIPLSNFDKVDLEAVREIGFLVETGALQDEKPFIISEILFTR